MIDTPALSCALMFGMYTAGSAGASAREMFGVFAASGKMRPFLMPPPSTRAFVKSVNATMGPGPPLRPVDTARSMLPVKK
jgi:hypothetical protein